MGGLTAVCRRRRRLHPRRRWRGRLVCAAKSRAPGKRSGYPPNCRPSGQGLRGKSPCPARHAPPCRVNPLPQAARAAPTQRRIFVRTEARVSGQGAMFGRPSVDDGCRMALLLYFCARFICFSFI